MGGLLYATPVHAAGLIPDPTGRCPEDYASGTTVTTPLGQPCKDGASRDYSLGDVKSVMARIGNFMLGISGAVALVVFVVGGFYFVMSAGNSKMVSKGIDLMVSGVIGLIILFSSYTIIAYGIKTFVGSEGDQFLPKASGPAAAAGAAGGGAAQSYAISVPMTGVTADAQCSFLTGTDNNCVSTATCPGTLIDGACATGKKCCFPTKAAAQTTLCGKLGGTCTSNSSPCNGGNGAFASGLCPGAATVQCCLPAQ